MNNNALPYGHEPVELGQFPLQFTEMMHYLYLPISMRNGYAMRIPRRLEFLSPLIRAAILDSHRHDDYIYVTARHGFATPDNPLNRPGWHCDGFGTDDTNYVWMDRWGSRVALQKFWEISESHVDSLGQFEQQISHAQAFGQRNIYELETHTLYRFDPYVVHTTPIVPSGGGMRSFVKISISRHQYNLAGNSHNYLFDYDWEMFPRSIVRNDPAHNQADFYAPPKRTTT